MVKKRKNGVTPTSNNKLNGTVFKVNENHQLDDEVVNYLDAEDEPLPHFSYISVPEDNINFIKQPDLFITDISKNSDYLRNILINIDNGHVNTIYLNNSAAGTGKTHETLDKLVWFYNNGYKWGITKPQRIVIAFGRHVMIEEWFKHLDLKYNKNPKSNMLINYLHVKGINKGCVDEERQLQIQSLFARNIKSKHHDICKECGDKCGRRKILQQIPNFSGIIFCSQHHLNNLFYQWEGEIDTLVIEEQFLNSLIQSCKFNKHHFDIPLQYFEQNKNVYTLLKALQTAAYSNDIELFKVDDLPKKIHFNEEIYENWLIENTEHEPNIVSSIIETWNILEGDIERFKGSINMKYGKIEIHWFENPFRTRTKKLRDENGKVIVDVSGKPKEVEVRTNYGIIINDASTDADTYKSVLNRNVWSYKEVNGIDNLEVIALNRGSLSMKFLNRDGKFEKYAQIILWVSKLHKDKKIVVFIQKKIKSDMEEYKRIHQLDNVDIEHYWSDNSTSSNIYKDYDYCIDFGSAFVNPSATSMLMNVLNISKETAFKLQTLDQKYQSSSRIRGESPFNTKPKTVILLTDKIPTQYKDKVIQFTYEELKRYLFGDEVLKDKIIRVLQESEKPLSLEEIIPLVKKTRNDVYKIVNEMLLSEEIKFKKEGRKRLYHL